MKPKHLSNKDGTIRLSVSIMAMKKRAFHVKQLQEAFAPSEVFVSWGDTYDTLWENARNAWEHYDPEATHHLLLQDDAILCNNFINGAFATIGTVPDKILSFFLMDLIVKREPVEGTHWVVGYSLGTVSICFPVPTLKDFLKWETDFYEAWGPDDDVRINGYMLFRLNPLWNCIPSIVDHNHMESLLCHLNGSTAEWYIGETDPETIDWSENIENVFPVWSDPDCGDQGLMFWTPFGIKKDKMKCFFCFERNRCYPMNV